MSQKNIILFAIVSVLLLLLVHNLKQNAKEAFLMQKGQLVTFEKEAKEIGQLKRRFSDKQANMRTLNTLKRISKPSKEFDKGKKKVLEFDQLTVQKLNALLRKIENSSLKIKRLSVDRIDDLHAKVRLEIAK
jgi:competence protein ComGC